MTRPLVVKVTCGAEEPERLNQAFTVAAAALASGAEVSLWLTGEAAWFGVPGRAEDFSLPEAAPLADLLAAVIAPAAPSPSARSARPVGGSPRPTCATAYASPAPPPSPRRSWSTAAQALVY